MQYFKRLTMRLSINFIAEHFRKRASEAPLSSDKKILLHVFYFRHREFDHHQTFHFNVSIFG
ncbi:hypothetical protein B6V75_18280, partial [Thioclava sp. F1Mire-8]